MCVLLKTHPITNEIIVLKLSLLRQCNKLKTPHLKKLICHHLKFDFLVIRLVKIMSYILKTDL